MDILTALMNLFSTPAYASPEESYFKPGQAITKQFEGFRANPYLDTVGVPTIGYGFNMRATPGLPNPMSRQTADKLFEKYYTDADSLAMKFAGPRWGSLSDAQKTVLTDMAYNLHNKLYGFKNMRSALMAGDDSKVQQEMTNSKWYSQVGNRGIQDAQNWNS